MSLLPEIKKELPQDVFPKAIDKIDRINGTKQPQSLEELSADVRQSLEQEFPGEALEKELNRLHMGTPEEFSAALRTYLALRRAHPDLAFHTDAAPRRTSDISDTVLFLIDYVMQEEGITDRYEALAEICSILEKKFGTSSRLESNLERLNLRTTKDVLHAIDMYLTMRRLYPNTIFGPDRLRKSWTDVLPNVESDMENSVENRKEEVV